MSKFDKIFEAREETAAAEPVVKPTAKSKIKTKAVTPKTVVQPDKPDPANIVENDNRRRRRGRPAAKRSDPNFIGFTTYIRKDTHLKVKISLLQEGQGRELSELVETLLSDWVAKR